MQSGAVEPRIFKNVTDSGVMLGILVMQAVINNTAGGVIRRTEEKKEALM